MRQQLTTHYAISGGKIISGPVENFMPAWTDSEGVCKICRGIIGSRGHFDAERLNEVGICPTCDFWIEKWQMRNNDNVVRVNGQHYMFGNHLQDARITQDTTLEMLAKSMKKKSGLGMGGSSVIIRMNDGRVIITNDLWHQGTIPAHFKNVMPNNAEMVFAS